MDFMPMTNSDIKQVLSLKEMTGCVIALRVAYDRFPVFFHVGSFIDNTYMKL